MGGCTCMSSHPSEVTRRGEQATAAQRAHAPPSLALTPDAGTEPSALAFALHVLRR